MSWFVQLDMLPDRSVNEVPLYAFSFFPSPPISHTPPLYPMLLIRLFPYEFSPGDRFVHEEPLYRFSFAPEPPIRYSVPL